MPYFCWLLILLELVHWFGCFFPIFLAVMEMSVDFGACSFSQNTLAVLNEHLDFVVIIYFSGSFGLTSSEH